MKLKQLFTSIFSFAAAIASSQTTITSATFMQAGQTFIQADDTLGFSTYDPGNAGANQVWDFTDFEESSFDTMDILNAASTPNAAQFPSANYAFYNRTDDTYGYFAVTPTLLTAIGVSGDQTDMFGSIAFNPAAREFKFPFNYLDTIHTRRGFQFAFSGADFGQPEVDSIRFSTLDVVIKEADAWGQLSLTSGTYNVLRLRESGMSYSTTAIKIPMVGWMQNGTDSTEVLSYTFQAEGIAVPILTLTMDADQDTVTSATAYKSSTVGIMKPAEKQLVNVYPNPVSDVLTVVSNHKLNLQIFDVTGKLLESHNLTESIRQLSVSHLSEGIYILHFTDANGNSSSERLIVQ